MEDDQFRATTNPTAFVAPFFLTFVGRSVGLLIQADVAIRPWPVIRRGQSLIGLGGAPIDFISKLLLALLQADDIGASIELGKAFPMTLRRWFRFNP